MIPRLAVFTSFALLFLALAGSAGAETFSSSSGNSINVGTSGGIYSADTYPSSVEVSGTVGAVTDVDVIIPFTSLWAPSIFHFLLVAPDGTAVTLMSGAGGTHSADPVAVNLRFDQGASQMIPESGNPVTAAAGQTLLYRPASYWSKLLWRFPGIDPSTSVEPDLNRFNGRAANGTWRLYFTGGYGAGSGGESQQASVDKWSLDVKTAGDTTAPAFSRPAVSGRTLGFDLTEAGSVRLRVDRVGKGIKVKSKCLAPKKGRKGKSCRLYTPLPGAIDFAGVAGPNSFAWNGRIGSKKLAPGKYRLTATATDAAGNASSPRTFTVTIKKPKKRR